MKRVGLSVLFLSAMAKPLIVNSKHIIQYIRRAECIILINDLKYMTLSNDHIKLVNYSEPYVNC